MSTLSLSPQGRYGNQCVQFLFAYAFAQKRGMKFECPEWIGEKVFSLPPYHRPSRSDYERVNEITIFGPNRDMEFRGYGQMQRCADFYTKREAQAWMRLRPEIEQACRAIKFREENSGPLDTVICHRRVGDYAGYNYPIVSERSYHFAMAAFGLDLDSCKILTEENPTNHYGLPDELAFLADFYRMMTAPTLLRGNSTFSWLAGLLGKGIVLSPVIDGLEGGREHHGVPFVAGNYPRLANFDFTTELWVNDKPVTAV